MGADFLLPTRATFIPFLSFLLLLLLVVSVWHLARAERVARHVGIPVHERAVRIVLPRPHMQRGERRQSEAIRAGEVMEPLGQQPAGFIVLSGPVGGEDN